MVRQQIKRGDPITAEWANSLFNPRNSFVGNGYVDDERIVVAPDSGTANDLRRFELKENLAGVDSATAYVLKYEDGGYTIGDEPEEFELYCFLYFWSGYGRDGETAGTRGWCKKKDGHWEVIGTDGPVIGTLTADLTAGGTAGVSISIGGAQTVTAHDGCIPGEQKIPSGTKVVLAIIDSKWYVISAWVEQDVVTEISTTTGESGSVSFSYKTTPVTVLAKGEEENSSFGESVSTEVVTDVKYESHKLQKETTTVQTFGASEGLWSDWHTTSSVNIVESVYYDTYDNKLKLTKGAAYVMEIAAPSTETWLTPKFVETLLDIRHQTDGEYIEGLTQTLIVIDTANEAEWENKIATTDCEEEGSS